MFELTTPERFKQVAKYFLKKFNDFLKFHLFFINSILLSN